jgi:hypothetical protein
MNNINLVIASIIIGTLLLVVVVNESYSQYSQEDLKKYRDNCTQFDYLANLTNIKIVSMLIGDKYIKEPCIDRIDQFLEQGFTIKGTLQDKFIILEKTK